MSRFQYLDIVALCVRHEKTRQSRQEAAITLYYGGGQVPAMAIRSRTRFLNIASLIDV